MPQSVATSDLDISSRKSGNTINVQMAKTIGGMKGVKQVYGRRSFFKVPAALNGNEDPSHTVDLLSFDEFDLEGLEKDGMLKQGSDLDKVRGNSSYVLATWDRNSSWEIGDKVFIGNEKLEIAGLLKYDPFSADGLTNGKITLITSGETFIRITGVTDYSLLMVQLTGHASDADVEAIHNALGDKYNFSDKRGQRTEGIYMAFVTCVYAFLAIITLVTVLNIINSISMSVSARIKQYGAMRAVGMDQHQMAKMIAAEAFTYAVWGCAAGCAVGLPLSKLLYDFLITAHFKYAVWSLPVASLSIILLFVVFAAIAAAYAPIKRMRRISVTETINEL